MQFDDFTSKGGLLRGEDVTPAGETVTISAIEERQFEGEKPKAVIYFREDIGGVVCNATRIAALRALAPDGGVEMESLVGVPVVMYQTMVNFSGRQVPSIAFRAADKNGGPPVSAPRGANAAT